MPFHSWKSRMIDNHDEVIFNLKIELESLRPNIINHHFNLCESAHCNYYYMFFSESTFRSGVESVTDNTASHNKLFENMFVNMNKNENQQKQA